MPRTRNAKGRRESRLNDDFQDCDDDRTTQRSPHMMQMTAELVPNFSGCDKIYPVSRWIEDVESNSEIFGWSPLQQLLVARRSLTGTAQLWLRAERPFKSWEDLRAALVKEFPDALDSKAIHELMGARKKRENESCLDYMLIMKELGRRGKIADYVAIKYIVDGIIDIETNKMMLYGVSTYSDLKEKLQVYETIVSKMRTSASVQRNNEAKLSSKQQSGRRIRCYSCGELGHASTECPHKHKGLKCFKCNEFGHVGATCKQAPKKNEPQALANHRKSSGNFGIAKAWQGYQHDNDAKKTMFSTMSGDGDAANFTPDAVDGGASSVQTVHIDKSKKTVYDNDDSDSDLSTVTEVLQVVNKHRNPFKKPIIVAKLCERDVRVLIDSGSDVNIIATDIYSAIGSPECEQDDITLTGLGLSKVRSLGKCRLRLCYDGQCYEDVVFHVINRDLIPYDAIIGLEFLNDVTVVMRGGSVSFVDKGWEQLSCFASDLCSIDSVIGPMADPKLKQEVIQCVESYKPQQVKEVPLQLKIVLKDDVPVVQRARRLSLMEQEIVERQVTEWLENDIIRVSYSEYSSPLVLVKKKDGSTRVCVDYRLVNKKIMKDEFPLPITEDLIDKLKDAKVYSVLDLKNAFFHLKVSEESIPYTSFVTHHGQFEFLRAPFGLSICPKYFMRFISIIFRDLLVKGEVMIFIDDLLIPARNEIEAVHRLKNVLSVAEQYGLEINWKKANLISQEIEYLGHHIKNGEVRPTSEKIDAVLRYPKPTSVKQVRSFLGLTSYFRKYMQDYAVTAKPLTDLLKKDLGEFKFGEEQLMAFETLKLKLSEGPVLKIYDSKLPTELHTDASSVAYSAILLQFHPDGWHPVYYMSKRTSEAESRYSSYELEALAIIEGVKKFRVYLLGIHFKIVTDCQAFELTLKKKDVTPKIARWVLFLDQFDYEVEHRPGPKMQHADALSRNPCMTIVINNLHDQIRLAQQNDEGLKAICQVLRDNNTYMDYWIDNGLLYKGEQKLLVIPRCLENEIIKQVHSNGHFSVRKMKELIVKDYYIKDLEKKLQNFTISCIPCILATRKAGKQEGYLNPIEKEGIPLHTLHIDHVGPLTETRKLYNYILTIVDAFTKFTWIFPTKSTTSKETLDKLKIHQQQFGNPARIITDRGTAFTSGEFRGFCQTENIQHVTITTGVPRGNGQVERLHRTILSVLTKLCVEDPSAWYRHVSRVQRTLNSTHQRSINTSPFQLMIGIQMRSKEDMQIIELLKQEEIEEYDRDRDELRMRAKQQILKVQEENRKTFDRNRKESSIYNVGDLVAIKRTQFGPGLKLKPKYLGPYRITKAKRNDRYDVEKMDVNTEGPNKTSSAADQMKRWPIPSEE